MFFVDFQNNITMSGDGLPTIKSTHSLVAKYVTGPIWEKLSKVKTKVRMYAEKYAERIEGSKKSKIN
jgi:hypothetical protein